LLCFEKSLAVTTFWLLINGTIFFNQERLHNAKGVLMSNLAYALSTEYTQVFPVSSNVQILQQIPVAPQEYYEQSDEGRYVDEATYWNDYYEAELFHYEWNNGYLEVKEMPTIQSAMVLQWFINLLEHFLEANPIAHLLIEDIAFKVNLPNKTAIRRPDLSIILHTNPYQPKPEDKSYAGIYDMCIEFLSDSKKKYIINDTVKKKGEYSQSSVKEYYIIDTMQQHTAFYKLDNRGRYVPIQPQNGVIKSTVLSGFQFRKEDIYLIPDQNSLIDDPVYKSFIKLDLQEQIKIAEKERMAKEDAVKIAENERMAKEDAVKIAENERMAKEDAVKIAEKERMAKESALEENSRLLNLLKQSGLLKI
jgi:hypothetical protein